MSPWRLWLDHGKPEVIPGQKSGCRKCVIVIWNAARALISSNLATHPSDKPTIVCRICERDCVLKDQSRETAHGTCAWQFPLDNLEGQVILL
jgi:hypothetical protein